MNEKKGAVTEAVTGLWYTEKTGRVRTMQNRQMNSEYHITTVCVDTYGSGQLTGRLYNPWLPQAVPVRSVMELILFLDHMLDEMDFPQEFMAKRAFLPRRAVELPLCSGGEPVGRAATFSVQVLFRQNASWQGRVVWREENRSETFRSALELLFLIHSALDGAKCG